VATKRRTRITIETHQLWVVRAAEALPRRWCAGCHAQVEHIAAEQAARLAGRGLRALCREIEAGLLHAIETQAGALLVCVPSLLNHTSRGEREL
jgi:hypothetical protein